MIEFFKLAGLPSHQCSRKIIKILEQLERECSENSNALPSILSCDSFYIRRLLSLIVELYPNDESAACMVQQFLSAESSDINEYRRIFNSLRHMLYGYTGITPSEWDLIAPGKHYAAVCDREKYSRPFFSNVYVYAEDIRAPFNLGSVFRTAEAFGVEKLFLSHGCVSPEQSKARRSAMGCIDYVPWERSSLECLPAGIPVFALETGGCAIDDFSFPKKGIVVIGSEELGLSAAALQRASAGVVSIPMRGIKASLNVSVAFGILMQYWAASITTK